MNHVDSTKNIVSLSACTGSRGLERGVERALKRLRYGDDEQRWQAGDILKVAAYMEIEAFVAYNLVAQMEQGVLDPAPVFTDLKQFPWGRFYNKVHLLTGGYPCQPFSQAGLQNGTDDPRHLFPFIESGIDAARPILCFFENVANHLNIGYSEVRRRISQLGYKVEADIFAAHHVGAPHLRKRLFILAVADTYCDAASKKRGDLQEILGISEAIRQVNGAAILEGDRASMADTDQFRRGIQQQLGSSEGEGTRHQSEGSDRELGHTERQGPQGEDGLHQSTLSSKSGVGNADHTRQQQSTERESRRRTEHTSQDVDHSTVKLSESDDKVRSRRNATSSAGTPVDHSSKPRLEGQHRSKSARVQWQSWVRSIASTSVWPLGQGPYQWEWEEPRLESRVGFSAYGYNYTEDLLRMAGNSVVPQQAELAFITLIQKFL